jgi:hypothetical protein
MGAWFSFGLLGTSDNIVAAVLTGPRSSELRDVAVGPVRLRASAFMLSLHA